MEENTAFVGQSLQRSVLSPDGRLLAAISTDQKIHLVDLAAATKDRKAITGIKVPQSARTFLRECAIIRWSPETMWVSGKEGEALSNTTSESELSRTWLLLSDGDRLIALSAELRSPRVMRSLEDEPSTRSNILTDYKLGKHFGRLTLAEFVFNHRHALVFFEAGTNAAILSMTKPQREDIPHVKFSDSRSLAMAPDARYFSLLRRDRGQDRVTVFELGQNNEITYKSFDANTADAQSMVWCPAGSPVIAVCDSATHGTKLSFFTAQGHPLKLLDITSTTFGPSVEPVEGLGVTHWQWIRTQEKDDNRTIQIVTTAQAHVLIRYHTINSMVVNTLASFRHTHIVDGAHTTIWQETVQPHDPCSPLFIRQTGTFDALKEKQNETTRQFTSTFTSTPNPTNSNPIDITSLNCDQTLLATRTRSLPHTLFLWKLEDITPNTGDAAHPHVVLLFSHPIKQALWHPRQPNILVILTTNKRPMLYAWTNETFSPPISGAMPFDSKHTIYNITNTNMNTSTNYSASWLLECTKQEERRGHRVPILLTSKTAYEAGYLSDQGGQLVFESIITQQPLGPLETSSLSVTEEIDTPSRRPEGSRSARSVIEPNTRTGKENPDSAEAGSMKAQW
ncbi:uncharacterized protein PV06_04868 [Exophiala oligosperma]|uniref:Uncharacterized protein n=1 Tax=Exophiala oligosperma TaxID=215243 RepID=A0A0D2DLE0_9EURO|nr:uncharacterized protein PV06_04868 [Exophiala oligosperma]KIW43803.1 hypothetical protein PV06_04868 [Exophiala oligosperma]